MLVVVRVVRGMAMLPVQVVHVVFMAHSDMSAVGRVNVHVGAVRKMRLVDRLVAVGQLIDMVVARRVHVSVMEVVHVVIVWHGRMTAPLVGCLGTSFTSETLADDGTAGICATARALAYPTGTGSETSTGAVLQVSTIGGGAWPRR